MYKFFYFLSVKLQRDPLIQIKKSSQTYFKKEKKKKSVQSITSVIGIEVTKKTKEPYESKSKTQNGEMSDTQKQ